MQDVSNRNKICVWGEADMENLMTIHSIFPKTQMFSENTIC